MRSAQTVCDSGALCSPTGAVHGTFETTIFVAVTLVDQGRLHLCCKQVTIVTPASGHVSRNHYGPYERSGHEEGNGGENHKLSSAETAGT